MARYRVIADSPLASRRITSMPIIRAPSGRFASHTLLRMHAASRLALPSTSWLQRDGTATEGFIVTDPSRWILFCEQPSLRGRNCRLLGTARVHLAGETWPPSRDGLLPTLPLFPITSNNFDAAQKNIRRRAGAPQIPARPWEKLGMILAWSRADNN